MLRVLLAGILGGIAMYAWSSIAHVATPLGQVGISTLPNEAVTLTALASTLGDKDGLYFFPDMRPGHPAASDPPAGGASGFLVYHPHGAMQMDVSKLGIEFAVELAEAMIAAVLLSFTTISGFVARVGFVSLMGLAASIATNLPYWNWYGFPTNYTAVAIFLVVMGYFVAGLAIAVILPKPGTET